jgi:flavin-dependent dehydrogenase
MRTPSDSEVDHPKHHLTQNLTPRPGSRSETVDVVVVGARCAGAATAMLLARAGHDVVVVDRAAFPSDTISTHAIARGGVVQLRRWGLLDAVVDSGAPEIRRVEFHAGSEPTVRTVKDRHGVDFLVAPRRHTLDPLLQAHAMAAGARLRTNATVTEVMHDSRGRVVGVAGRDDDGRFEIRARFVVGADGLRSRIARSVGAPVIEQRPSTSATHYAYFAGNWPAMEYHLGAQSFAGVFPTNDGAACVWVCAPDDWALEHRRRQGTVTDAFHAMVAETSPGLAERLREDTVATSTARGMMSLPNQIREPFGDGWVLVGDAGYHRDAITGHGISDAFRDAELVAVALDRALRDPGAELEALERYAVDRERMLREIFEITCELATMPPLTRFVELQKQLGVAIDRLAGEFAERPMVAVSAP